MTRGCRLVYRGFMNVAMCSECALAACNDAEKPPKQGCWRTWSLLIMCYIIRRCSRAPDASILVMPRRVFPAEAFYSLSRFVSADAQVFSADARPRTPAARLIASRRSASARRHWTLRRCLGPCRLAEAPFGSSRLPDTKAAPRADTKLHESANNNYPI